MEEGFNPTTAYKELKDLFDTINEKDREVAVLFWLGQYAGMIINTGKAGPTGHFPEGKLNDGDKGEIAIKMGVDKGRVIIDFGSPLSWIGMQPAQAKAFGKAIIEKAESV